MQSQPTPGPLYVSPAGVIVVDGYGIKIRVERGRLVIFDGIGPLRREARFSRATHGLRRLVLLGYTGFVTLEAIRWLSDVGVAIVHIDADGRTLLASTGMGRDDPRLRRAQASALDTATGNDIARRLIAEKIAAQAETLAEVDRVAPVSEASVVVLQDMVGRLHVATSRDEIRQAEAIAAAAYWSAWATVPVRFARRDIERVPDGWRAFGVRTSPLTGSPRLAVNPANALLNYLYAFVETEARLACLAVGLDPGLGVLHADQRARDSLALDIVEPIRPVVDRFVLRMLAGRGFRVADFVETQQGACRILAPLTHELAVTMLDWRSQVGAVAERVAALVIAGRPGSNSRQPTPLTQDNRSAGRVGQRIRERPTAKVQPTRRSCVECGAKITVRGRRYCDTCRPAFVGFRTAGDQALALARANSMDPAHGGVVARIRGDKWRERRRLEAEWEHTHGKADPHEFSAMVLPRLAGIATREVVEVTGMTRAYCSKVLKGELVPHARWWTILLRLATPTEAPD